MTLSGDNKKLRRKNMTGYALLCAVCILLNLIPAWLVKILGLPLWMDTIGTILAAIIGGYLPGIFVGFVTNLLKGFTDTTSIYYAALNVLISVAATYLAGRGWLKRVWSAVLFAICLALIGGGLGGILPWLLNGFPTYGFINDLGIDALDKLISVAIVFVILRFIPDRLKHSLYFKLWRQTPLTVDEEKEVKNIKCRSISVRTKMLLILMVSLLLLAVVATIISFILYRNSMISEYAKIATNVSNLSINAIDADSIDEYLEKGEAASGYIETEKELYTIRDAAPDVLYLYVYKILEDGCHVVFDLDSEDLEGGAPGDVFEFDESFKPLLPKLFAGEPIDPIVTNDSFGWLLTVYQPIMDSTGKCAAYVGTDISMSTLINNELSFIIQMIFLFLGFVVLILAIAVWFVDYGIIYPVNSMALRTGEIDFEDTDNVDEALKRLKRLDIKTGDEIENLYNKVVNMTEESAEYLDEIHQKSETISKMQNSLIMVLADMVESRDQNTGQHIRKTAAYVDIILHKMKEMGIHEDVLTDEYISNVVNSAPLHDIGKIQVPDAVLNKPGKLDDFEFDIMKTHTTAGSDVIDRVIEEVPESAYLKEARDIANYHHEKWNGKGYPAGIEGTDIPLSARVMAVADVFDALVSERIYKPAMPLEKAFDIIKNDSGTHFDPEVVEAFFAAKDEVIRVKESFDKKEED